jgi:hypothetical protein
MGVMLSRNEVEAKNLTKLEILYEIIRPEFILGKSEGASE